MSLQNTSSVSSMINTNNLIFEYTKSTKHVILLTVIGIMVLLSITFTPLKNIKLFFIICKILLVLLFLYIIYDILKVSINYTKKFNVNFIDGSWDQLKSNIIGNYVYIIFLIILITYIIRIN
jgi:type III secretory pathway component EscS